MSSNVKGHLGQFFRELQRLRSEQEPAIQREILAHMVNVWEQLDLAYWRYGADGRCRPRTKRSAGTKQKGHGFSLAKSDNAGYNAIMTTKPVVIFTVDAALLEQIDVFRFKHRFPARSTAMKFLLRAGLKSNLKPEAADLVREELRKPRARSSKAR